MGGLGSGKQTPKLVKLLEGNHRKCRDKVQKVYTVRLPNMPKGLDQVAKTHWNMICRTRTAWLDESDACALEHVCRTWSLLQKARRVAEKAPEHGPSVSKYLKLLAVWQKSACRFGLDPVAREALGETKEEANTNNKKAARYLA